uniref:Putative secreted protein n=1 Tax=Anopheles darlingi TaxID=43151 RepID=A0A2M4DE43_ANODA
MAAHIQRSSLSFCATALFISVHRQISIVHSSPRHINQCASGLRKRCQIKRNNNIYGHCHREPFRFRPVPEVRGCHCHFR